MSHDGEAAYRALVSLIRGAVVEAAQLERQPEEIAEAESLFVDLSLDSLAYLEVWLIVEEAIGIEVDDEDMLGDVRTVGDLVRRVQSIQERRSSPATDLLER